jgi:adenylate cyclase
VSDATLSEEELAGRAGISVERVRALVDLGILEAGEGRFLPRDVLRARVVADLESKGIDPSALAAALATGDLTLGYLESAGRRFPRSDRTFSQLAEEIGVSLETLQRVFVAYGLPRPGGEERVREEDLPMLRTLPVLFGAGLDEGDVLRASRMWGDAARRVAEFLTHFFHHSIEERFRQRGLRDNEAFEAAIREVGVRIGQSGESLLAWLYRRHGEGFFLEHQVRHVETALEQAGVRQAATRGDEAAAFADLTGYTTLTEESGDEAAAKVSLALAQLVSEIAAHHRGTVVKMLGDGVHFHFSDPSDAVRASLDIVEQVRPRGLPPAHVGVNAGPMIYDEGDYFGRTVNIAARIAAQAGADEVFVGEDLVRAVEPRGFRLDAVGAFELKGVSQPVRIHRAVRTGS